MRLFFALCLTGLAVLSGCAAQRAPLVTLQPAPDFEVAYAGSVGEAGDMPALSKLEPGQAARSKRQVFLSARVMRVSASMARELVGDAGAVGVSQLLPQQMDQLVEAARTRGVELVSAPQVLVLDGQVAQIEVGTQTAFISGFEVKEQGRARIADPVIRHVPAGLTMGVQPRLQASGEIHLRFELQFADVVRPVTRSTVKVFGSAMTIETPTVLTQRVSGSGLVAPRQGLLLTGLVGAENEVLLVMLRAVEFKPPAVEEGVDVAPETRPRRIDDTDGK